MVPTIDGYNNTIKSEMEPPCSNQALPQTTAYVGSVFAESGLAIQLALNGFPTRTALLGMRCPVLRIRCEGRLPAECATTHPHCPSTTLSNLLVYQLQVDHRPLHAITREWGQGLWHSCFWILACAGMTNEKARSADMAPHPTVVTPAQAGVQVFGQKPRRCRVKPGGFRSER